MFGVHVEVVQAKASRLPRDELEAASRAFLRARAPKPAGVVDPIDFGGCEVLSRHARAIRVEADGADGGDVAVDDGARVHVHRLCWDDEARVGADGDDSPAVATLRRLPCERFDGLWESLAFERDLKRNALRLFETALAYAERGADPNAIASNRLMLFHGPPGTGKTSLCRALAQKLAVRLGDRFASTTLCEIDAHGLFSRWFSESGKLVARAFEAIGDAAENRSRLVCVLVDEVETLAHARSASLSGADPSDAVRVVNAVLTHLDRLRSLPNVLVMATSNVTEAVDGAFVDRADLAQFVGPPSREAAFAIYRSALRELMRVGIVSPPREIVDWPLLAEFRFERNALTSDAMRVLELATRSVGLSGRALKRMPVIAHAFFVVHDTVEFDAFVDAMNAAIAKANQDKAALPDLSERMCRSLIR